MSLLELVSLLELEKTHKICFSLKALDYPELQEEYKKLTEWIKINCADGDVIRYANALYFKKGESLTAFILMWGTSNVILRKWLL